MPVAERWFYKQLKHLAYIGQQMVLSENMVVIGSPSFYQSVHSGTFRTDELKPLSLSFMFTLSIHFHTSVSYLNLMLSGLQDMVVFIQE